MSAIISNDNKLDWLRTHFYLWTVPSATDNAPSQLKTTCRKSPVVA